MSVILKTKKDFLRDLKSSLLEEPPHKTMLQSLTFWYEVRHVGVDYEPQSTWKVNTENTRVLTHSETLEIYQRYYKIDYSDIKGGVKLFDLWVFFKPLIGFMAEEYLGWKRKITLAEAKKILGFCEYRIERDYPEMYKLLLKLVQYEFSLANMIPVPYGFEGRYVGKRGKYGYGRSLERDASMLDAFYHRLQFEEPPVYFWIEENKEELCLSPILEYKSSKIRTILEWEDFTNFPFDDYMESLEQAIFALEKRAKMLAANN